MAKLERIGTSAAVAALILASCSSGSGHQAGAAPSTSVVATTSATTPSTVTASSLVLAGADLPGFSATSQPAATPIPCGSKFGDTAASTTRTSVAFATSGNQQTVNETVAVYPTAGAAAAIASAFRAAASSCVQFDETQGPTRTYQVRSVTLPAVNADDSTAVALASPAQFYDLVLLRSGARLAWLSLGQLGNPVDTEVLASVTSAASQHLGS